MNEQKPTGPKPRWWSRPQSDRLPTDEPGPAAPQTPSPPAHPALDGTSATGAPEPQDTRPASPPPPSPEAGAARQEPPTETGPAEQAASAPGVDEDAAAPAGHADPACTVPAAALPRQPLHAPDPYGTPPYGGPGPWAPAPPVQRPVPAQHGGPQPASAAPQPPVPDHHPAPQAPGGPAHPAPQAPGPAHPAPQAPTPSQWLQYDPWAVPAEPFSRVGVPARRRRGGGLLVGAVVLALVAAAIGGGVGAYVERTGGLSGVTLPQAGKEPPGRAPDSVAGIAASALPSVVTIHVTGAAESGTGTGFVLDNAGHILTNNHVVKAGGGSGKISVTFSGGESVAGEVVGRDSGYDLAVVRVSGVSGMKPLPLGNSDNVAVGDPVVAIGAPFDLSNTVTSGIISAKERPITAGGEDGDGTDVSYVDALQTDAPINPGNSGGPLVDSRARVIGINSAIRSAGSGGTDGGGGQAGSIGLGFAIPINQAKRVAEELINTGRATHPVIGVTLDMKFTGDGARVADKATDGTSSVTAGGPGDTAGIEPRDVITKVDGQRVHGGEELIVRIRAHRPGDRLALTLTRDGEERRFTLTLGSSS
ncbi:trypsin-like peptidase domain-containing protein [Streptomyces sp. NPDC048111]|uniref:trypsin-like peptidase domain-containing protein n=1 Tax=Streptomyces sp. NPDC048111 TaxID=3365500 RepID=UPI00371B2452